MLLFVRQLFQIVPCLDGLRAEHIAVRFEGDFLIAVFVGLVVVLHQALLHTPAGRSLRIIVVLVNLGVQRGAFRLRAVGALPQSKGKLDAVLRDEAVEVVHRKVCPGYPAVSG